MIRSIVGLVVLLTALLAGCTKKDADSQAQATPAPEVTAGKNCDLEKLREIRTNYAFISYAYCVALGRPADDGGREYWMQVLATKNDRLGVMQALAEAEEFSRGLHKGKPVKDLGDDDYFAFAYKRLLNREPTAKEIAALRKQAAGGKANRSFVSDGILASREARELHHL